MIKKEQIQEVTNKYDTNLKELEDQYNKEIAAVKNDTRFTDEAKKIEIQNIWEAHKEVEKKVRRKQEEEAMELLAKRREEAKEEVKKLKSKNINDSELTEKDIAYISGMLLNSDDETLKDIAKQYDYDIHVLNLINSRDSKKPSYTEKGQPTNNLIIKHPLELVETERLSEHYPSAYDYKSAIPTEKPFTGLWEQ